MKVAILAGGFGTRLSEETKLIPKPMVEIGGKPILWHIMKIYSYYGFNDFVILTGYKSHIIKDYFVHYYQQYSDITVDMLNNSIEIHKIETEPWKVTMLYTGQNTMTGSRVKKLQNYVGNEPFLLFVGFHRRPHRLPGKERRQQQRHQAAPQQHSASAYQKPLVCRLGLGAA